MKKKNYLKSNHKLNVSNMNNKTWETLKRFTLVINLMMNIYNMHKKFMKNGQEQVIYLIIFAFRYPQKC